MIHVKNFNFLEIEVFIQSIIRCYYSDRPVDSYKSNFPFFTIFFFPLWTWSEFLFSFCNLCLQIVHKNETLADNSSANIFYKY